MRYLKRFDQIFEAVIKPFDFENILTKLETMNDITIESINELFKEFDVEFVDVNYFISKLKTKKEIELVPISLELLGGIKFAAHNIYTNKIYICVMPNKFIESINSDLKSDMITFLREVLRHESIHKQQSDKRSIKIKNLEKSPVQPLEYYGSTDEIMAYAQSFIDQCRERGLSDKDILDQIKLKSNPISWVQNVYNKMPYEVKKRFNKYVYQYINM
jgi:hypothetical protein